MSGGMIKLERRFDASPRRVFRAWCDPEDLAAWIWGSLGRDVVAETDVRVGGAYRISTLSKDGVRWDFSGVYRVLEPPHRIAATLVWNAPMGYEPEEERIAVDLRDEGDRTLMVFTHDRIPDAESRRAHARGWSDSFDHLHRLLQGLSTE